MNSGEFLMKAKTYASSHRALIVEDHSILAEATAEFLRNYGLDVRIASTGQQALEMVSSFLPEIVLCDMRLPDMEGPDVARALRSLPSARKMVIAIHTAWTENEIRGMGEDVNDTVDLILTKPINAQKVEALLSAVRARNKKDKVA